MTFGLFLRYGVPRCGEGTLDWPVKWFEISIVGIRPLLLHNARLADPLDPIRKQLNPLTSKTKKTDTDHEKIGNLEWLAGFYYDSDLGPVIPGENLEKCLVEGARLTKDGKKIERGLAIAEENIQLQYQGPRDLDSLWNHVDSEREEEDAKHRPFRFRKTVVVARSRTVRVRPRFLQWGLKATGQIDPAQIDLETLEQAAKQAGKYIGLGDWRPRYGKFVSGVKEIPEPQEEVDLVPGLQLDAFAGAGLS